MFTKKQIILSIVLCLLPVIPGLLLYGSMPDSVPVHFDFSGQADGYGHKAVAVFFLPLFLAAMDLLTLGIISADPKRGNIGGAMKNLILWIMPAVSVFCSACILPAAMGYKLGMGRVAFVFVGAVMLVLGNYLPKTKQNYTTGIKLPWTLSSEENWNRTHRLAGFIWMACGALFIILGALRLLGPVLFTVLILMATLIPLVYSYLLYKKGI